MVNIPFNRHLFDRDLHPRTVVEFLSNDRNILDYNKIVVHSNYFIYNKCSKLTSKFYKSQVGRECRVRNTEVYY